MKFVIPTGRNNKTFSIIANASAYRISFPTFIKFAKEISGREIYEVKNNWNGTLNELRRPLMDKIKKYLSFIKK